MTRRLWPKRIWWSQEQEDLESRKRAMPKRYSKMSEGHYKFASARQSSFLAGDTS
jgi:hypothetical protein